MTPENPLASSENILGGALVFSGTRVPIHALMDYLTAGDTIDDFLNDFPSVTRTQVQAVLQMAESTLFASMYEDSH